MKEKLTGCFAAPKLKMALMSTLTVSMSARLWSFEPTAAGQTFVEDIKYIKSEVILQANCFSDWNITVKAL